ncbi:hypothetical protein [Zavarzinia sp. CC-PAN008]|uniref:hypothetical protein n=1 Tax=Zavarzinia sp. CC-PAN008 TaxID=3243332 RepID=UPI003F742DD3
MAVVNTKSKLIQNIEASPRVPNEVTDQGARLREIAATLEVAAADDDTSVFRICQVQSNWRIAAILLTNDAITSGTSYDVGLYQTLDNGGAVVDADAYASAVDLSSGRTAPLDVAFEARNIDKVNNRVWQDGGFSSDPKQTYELCLTANTVGSAAGTISVRVQYAID